MYLYSFSKFSGPDKIFTFPKGHEFAKKIKIGDLIRFGTDVFLCLGDEISFPEMYNYPYAATAEPEILYKKILSKEAIKMIHWMCYTYYTPYKSVIKYFLSQDWELLLKREKKGKNNPSIAGQAKVGQTLMVFPDLRTIYNMMDDKNFEKPGTSFLHAKQTQNQKDKERWAIKNGQSERIIASPSEIFQDFKNLEKIIFIDPHKWYYANQQDPRYKVAAVLERMKKIYDVEIEIINN